MNSNGIPEMIRAAGRSGYVTPIVPWWAWLSIGLVIGLVIGVVIGLCL